MISALVIAARLHYWVPASSGRKGVELRCVRVFGRHRVIWEYDGRGGLVKSVREAMAEATAPPPPAQPQQIALQLKLFNSTKRKGAVSEQRPPARSCSTA